MRVARRLASATLAVVAATALVAAGPGVAARALASSNRPSFAQWLHGFRARAVARGVSGATWERVTRDLQPDTTVFEKLRNQPEREEELWQYLNRCVSEWRITTGKAKRAEHAALLDRIAGDFGVEPSVMLGLWGIESAYGDPVVETHHARPVIPALATLAWGEPQRRRYWETEFLDALVIVDRGWATPAEMHGSWAGAMGHTQWMPSVWLSTGFDYDGDGRVSPFGKPDDALGSSARYLVEHGGYRRGEHWGFEVRLPADATPSQRARSGTSGAGASKTFAAWSAAGVVRADGKSFPQPDATARLWTPVAGGPAFLLGPNFYAVRTYNPSMPYTLCLVHLGDRVVGGEPFVQQFPGSERPPTLVEVQEIQRRLTALGFDTGGTDGRVGNDTIAAVRKFQEKIGMTPDGYAGVTLLTRLRDTPGSS